MSSTCVRILPDRMDQAIDLIQTRIDKDTRVCLTDSRINQDWVDEVMKDPRAYTTWGRVFGLYSNGILDTIMCIKVHGSFYTVTMMISIKDEKRRARIRSGYGVDTAVLLDFGLRQMEIEGFTTFYSVIPDHPKWKRAEANPNRPRKNVYSIEEVEKVPAGSLPSDPIHLLVMNRPMNLDMVVRKMTLRSP